MGLAITLQIVSKRPHAYDLINDIIKFIGKICSASVCIGLFQSV